MLTYIKTPRALVINIDGEPFNVRNTQKNYDKIYSQVKLANGSQDDQDIEQLKVLLKPIRRILFNKEYQIDVDDNGNLYLAGIEEMLPPELADYLKEAMEEQENIENLVNFFKLLMLNPDPAVRKQLFSFLQHNGHPISKHGYFVAYKYVSVKEGYVEKEVEEEVEVDEEIEGMGTVKTVQKKVTKKKEKIEDDHSSKGGKFIGYSEIITSARERARKAKQSAKRYFAFINDEDDTELVFKFFKKDKEPEAPEGFTFLGADEGLRLTLDELYTDMMNFDANPDNVKSLDSMAEEAQGTISKATKKKKKTVLQKVKKRIKSTVFTDTHSKTMEIRLGETVAMPREECDSNPNNTCSRGLHVGSMAYVKGNNLILNCLVSPADVVSVPRDYNNTKMRCCRYFAFSINHEEYKSKYTDIDYHDLDKEALQKALEEKVAGEEEHKIVSSIVSQSKSII